MMQRRRAVSESESESEHTSSSEESQQPEVDGRRRAMEIWRAYERGALPQVSRTSLPVRPSPAAEAAPMQAGAPEQLGMWNTEFRYAERRQTGVLMVDSLDRDWAAYPLPTTMRLHLPRTYRNVDRLDIVQIKFFNGIWPFSAARGNTTLAIADICGVVRTYTIADGNYTIAGLVAALNSVLVGSGVAVSYNAQQGRFVFTGAAPFTLVWTAGLGASQLAANSGWGLGWNLGFGGPAANVAAVLVGGRWVATASCCPRLYDDYFFLQLNMPEHMNMVDHTSPENAGVSQDSAGQVAHYFGKLLLNGFGCWAQTFVEMPKTFRPALGRLDFLTFTWLDRFGQPLAGPDAASCDWNMAVRVVEIAEGPSQTSALTMAGQTPAMGRGVGGHAVPLEHGHY